MRFGWKNANYRTAQQARSQKKRLLMKYVAKIIEKLAEINEK